MRNKGQQQQGSQQETSTDRQDRQDRSTGRQDQSDKGSHMGQTETDDDTGSKKY